MLLLLWTLLVQGMWLWLTAMCSMGGEDDWVPSAATVCGVCFAGVQAAACSVLWILSSFGEGPKGGMLVFHSRRSTDSDRFHSAVGDCAVL